MANPATGHQGIGIPSVNVPFVDDQGKITSSWLHFLLTIVSSKDQFTQIPVTEAPFVFSATKKCQLLISGGDVTQVEVSRDTINFVDTGQTSGPITLLQGDQCKITYNVAPFVVFMSL